jgi:hypothetical protein
MRRVLTARRAAQSNCNNGAHSIHGSRGVAALITLFASPNREMTHGKVGNFFCRSQRNPLELITLSL